MKKLATILFLSCCALSAFSQIRPNEIRVARGNEDYPPNEMHVNGKLTGLHVEVMEAVAAKIGHKIVWDELPWPRAQKCAEDGECDAITYISPSPEREKWGVFLAGNVLSQVEMRFMVHKSNSGKITFNGNAPEFLSGKTLLTLIGYNYGPDVAKAKKYEVKDLATMTAMVIDKRYDVSVVNANDFAGLKSREDLVLLNPPVWVSKSFVAFSKKANNGADLAAKFQSAYVDFMKTKDYLAIANRYKTTAK
jgi:polar amino acid transport system substrate-binding protein